MKLTVRTLFVVLALTLSQLVSFAQAAYVFKVLATSGKPEIKKASAWVPLRSGATLIDADEIRIGTNTYVGLVHVSGKSLELMKAGSFKIKELAGTIGKGSSVVIKYFDFMLSKNSDEAKQNRLVAVGSVIRTAFKEDILISLPENHHADLLNNKVIINWESKSDTIGPYTVSIQNMANEQLIGVEALTRSVTIDFRRPELIGESYFLVEIRNKKNKSLISDQYLIKRLQPEEQQKFKNEISEVISEIKEESAMQKIVLAAFYESNYLLIDAIVAYEEAIQLTPEVSFYKEAYEEFLLRNRLKFTK